MALRDVIHESPCPDCNGTGTRGGVRSSQGGVCQSCGGSGKVRQPPRVARHSDGGPIEAMAGTFNQPLGAGPRVTRRG